MDKLEDDSPMPYGMHKGKVMQEVPARYLNYIWNDGLQDKINIDPVADYINRNLEALEEEYPKGEW